MALRYECDDCGEIIEQIRIMETAQEGKEPHDRCFPCALAYLAEVSENSISAEFVNPALEYLGEEGTK